MASKIPRNAMSLKQFMLHQEVLKLYRSFLRSIKEIESPADRQQLREWVQSDFRKHRHETDEITIRNLVVNGERALKELKQSLALSRS
ncbi:LYR motif-containing protein 2 [Frankliniella fusca]|uniref:LYR motif-containing protein 2 n=1 Tax=Frankliniella fusca TaxID=407009 RepID=A0AAE1I5E2_9NEOP|nr:LYR motif-containing protein 2 [Frankliniella fusca]